MRKAKKRCTAPWDADRKKKEKEQQLICLLTELYLGRQDLFQSWSWSTPPCTCFYIMTFHKFFKNLTSKPPTQSMSTFYQKTLTNCACVTNMPITQVYSCYSHQHIQLAWTSFITNTFGSHLKLVLRNGYYRSCTSFFMK